jgi:hypothetical protein
VPFGHCAAHQAHREQARGSRHQRGYTSRWVRFRAQFTTLLLAQGIPPVCGAALPTGPSTTDSQCRAAGVWTTEDLQLHHDPPLTVAERAHHHLVCDPNRVRFLCASCHSAVTRRQQRGGDKKYSASQENNFPGAGDRGGRMKVHGTEVEGPRGGRSRVSAGFGQVRGIVHGTTRTETDPNRVE